jgi:hypothetical protein
MLKIRFYAGLSFFVLAWILPLFSFLVAKLNLALGTKAVIIGLLTLGGPELLGLLAVLCLGKENLLFIKERIFTWVKRLKPTAVVSRTRYRFGLVMFLLPIIPRISWRMSPSGCRLLRPRIFMFIWPRTSCF